MTTTLSSEVPIDAGGAPSWKGPLLLLAVNGLLVGLLVVLDRVYGVDYWMIVRDPNAIANQPAYFGFYSNMGSFLWVVAAATALFGAGCLHRAGVEDGRVLLLFAGGAFCTVAGLDDIFMFHEQSYRIGIPEKAVMAVYALFLLSVVAAAWPVYRATRWLYLLAALGCLGFSALVDMADLTISGAVLIEEALKFSGIAFLAAYMLSVATSTVSAALGDRRLR